MRMIEAGKVNPVPWLSVQKGTYPFQCVQMSMNPSTYFNHRSVFEGCRVRLGKGVSGGLWIGKVLGTLV